MSAELRELYQAVIIDHGRHPRHFQKLATANRINEGYNPLCGDRLTLYIDEQQGVIIDLSFEGTGCAISMASASLMAEALRGKSLVEAEQYFTDFHQLLTCTEQSDTVKERLGKLAVLAGVAEYPARVKCATLAWHTLQAALQGEKTSVSTE